MSICDICILRMIYLFICLFIYISKYIYIYMYVYIRCEKLKGFCWSIIVGGSQQCCDWFKQPTLWAWPRERNIPLRCFFWVGNHRGLCYRTSRLHPFQQAVGLRRFGLVVTRLGLMKNSDLTTQLICEVCEQDVFCWFPFTWVTWGAYGFVWK